jgi:hypothetical protein
MKKDQNGQTDGHVVHMEPWVLEIVNALNNPCARLARVEFNTTAMGKDLNNLELWRNETEKRMAALEEQMERMGFVKIAQPQAATPRPKIKRAKEGL